MKFLDDTTPGAGHFDQGLVRFHFRQGLVFLDRVTRSNAPPNDFGFMHTFPEIGKYEVRFVVWLLDDHEFRRVRSSISDDIRNSLLDPVCIGQVIKFKLVVRHGAVEACNSLNGRLEMKEALFHDSRCDFGTDSAGHRHRGH